MGSGLTKPCENPLHKNVRSKFHVQDLRAPLFRKHTSDLFDPKANSKYCSPRLTEFVMSGIGSQSIERPNLDDNIEYIMIGAESSRGSRNS